MREAADSSGDGSGRWEVVANKQHEREEKLWLLDAADEAAGRQMRITNNVHSSLTS